MVQLIRVIGQSPLPHFALLLLNLEMALVEHILVRCPEIEFRLNISNVVVTTIPFVPRR